MNEPSKYAQQAARDISEGALINPDGAMAWVIQHAIDDAVREAFREDLKFRYSHDEIEAACGGETAWAVRAQVMGRRKLIIEGNKERGWLK